MERQGYVMPFIYDIILNHQDIPNNFDEKFVSLKNCDQNMYWEEMKKQQFLVTYQLKLYDNTNISVIS